MSDKQDSSETPEKGEQPGAGPKLTLEQIQNELTQYPAPVAERYRLAQSSLSGRLAEETLQEWAATGLEIARKTVRSWEAASEFFDSSSTLR